MTEERESYSDTASHTPGTAKGEEKVSDEGKEAGRFDKEAEDDSGTGRPSGGSTARDSTSINPEDREPIDPAMPNLPPA